ncbi:SNF2 domain-containing protein CLASSY 3-like [Impatiens glandulifera]|uniref:SNF2 domain-containing protein CLASSY 3-like n=1 Tax=Impatiens glandulifera TaxID=253017 RepID=UPI001FB18637|nr:SNF2 domain-containing protein CLASSY 3-like [Impatiens glandulifera]
MDRGTSAPASRPRTRQQLNRLRQEVRQRKEMNSRVAESMNSSADDMKGRRAKRYSRSELKRESSNLEDSCSANVVSLPESSDSDDAGCNCKHSRHCKRKKEKTKTAVKPEGGRFGSQLGETSRKMKKGADSVQGRVSSMDIPVHIHCISSDSEHVDESESERESSLSLKVSEMPDSSGEEVETENSIGGVSRPKISSSSKSFVSDKSDASIATPKKLSTNERSGASTSSDVRNNENGPGRLKTMKRGLNVKDSQSLKDDGRVQKKIQMEGKEPTEPIPSLRTSVDEQVNVSDDVVEPKDPSVNQSGGDSWKEMAWMPLKKRHKFVDKDKIIADSFWDQIDLPDRDTIPPPCKDEADEQEFPVIPKNFGLQDTDYEPPEEKSYWDIVGDSLFEEMQFAIATEGIGLTHDHEVAIDDQTSLAANDSSLGLCEHFFILNEEIGILCKNCSYVKMEIRHVPPTFVKNPWGRITRKETREAKLFNLDRFQMKEQNNISPGSQHLRDDDLEVAGTVWSLIPGTRRNMYTHQRDGFEFIWKNIQGSINLDELRQHEHSSFRGNGCIISHAPGTGKTRLTIMFIQSYLERYPVCKVVIIAPCSMLLTWEDEFKKWKVNIPFHNLNKQEFSGHELDEAVNLVRQGRRQDKESTRYIKLLSWKKGKGVLGISYKLFEQLAGDRVFLRDEADNKKKELHHSDCIRVMKMLQQLPDLLVLDEGHTPRNEKSLIWKALSRVNTHKRVILSGTPFQNNFRELYNTLRLVSLEFADQLIANECGLSRSKKTTLDRWISLTSGFTKKEEKSVDKIRAIIYKMAHVYKGNILKDSLPGLRDSLVVLKPLELQTAILKIVMGTKNGVERDHYMSLVSVHPSLLLQSKLSEKPELSGYKAQLEALTLNPQVGVKTKFVIELIRLSQSLNERVLVFSQYINPLALIKDQLKSQFGWSDGKEILNMDGGTEVKLRQASISSFNDSDSGVKVLLASTKACSEGISLVGASRVVLLDVVWNPSVERQAISRAYRIGQKKLVYIYHLIAGEMESAKYDCQTQKDRLSELVFTSKEEDRVGGQSCTVAEDIILQEMIQHDKTCHMFEKIINHKDSSSLIETFG